MYVCLDYSYAFKSWHPCEYTVPSSVAAASADGEDKVDTHPYKAQAFGKHQLLLNGRSSPTNGLACLNKQESDLVLFQ